jgi:hypothetical protein
VATGELVGEPLEGGGVGDVEVAGEHLDARAGELGSRGLALGRVAGAQHHQVAADRELAGDLPADAAVGAGDDHDALHGASDAASG